MSKRRAGARYVVSTAQPLNSSTIKSAPGVTRTLDLRIRNPLLYPAELRAQFMGESGTPAPNIVTFSQHNSTVSCVKQRKRIKIWQTTRTQNLIRRKPGRYYASAFASGKEVWTSLHISVQCNRSLRGRQALPLTRSRQVTPRGFALSSIFSEESPMRPPIVPAPV